MKKLLKQKNIDRGELGGFFTVFVNSMFILGFYTFLNTSILVYQSFWVNYISVYLYIILLIIIELIWLYIYFIYIMPSMIKFSNRQTCAHENPVYIEIIELKAMIKELQEKK